ncbi:MAG: MarR family transcriptional regulator [Burkholderiales bacterium]|nr:MarR family transcriptional regulator [Burkholderiales bacterium]
MRSATRLQRFHSRPGFLLKRGQQVAAAIFLEECREFGLTSSQYGALCALAEYPGIDQIALGTLAGLDRSTVGLVIRLLSERGLVERYADQRDGRRKRIRLTAAGRRALRQVAPAARRVSGRMLSVLPKAERRRFLLLLGRFLAGHRAVIDVKEVLQGKIE